MKQLTNGTVQIITGADGEELTANYKVFLDALEAAEEEWSIVSVQPAMLVLLCEGDPEYLDVPNLSTPDAPANEEWAKRAAGEIVEKLDAKDAAKV